MKTTHTPGPWSCDTAGQPICIDGPQGSGPDVVALIYDCDCPPRGAQGGTSYYDVETAAANARLIAAAPELLAALQELRTEVEGRGFDAELSRLYDRCDAALAKATEGTS